MSPRDPFIRLRDMLEAIERIRSYTEGMEPTEFARDTKTYDAVLRNLTVLGEAARALPEGVRASVPDVPWRAVQGFRNIVVHEYFGVDTEIVWHTITDDLPELERAIRDALEAR